MAVFFEKLSNAVTFEVQMYILLAVFFVMMVFCFILLLIVGAKYRQLSSRVDELEKSGDSDEKAEGAEYAWIKEYINNTLQEEKTSAQEKQRVAEAPETDETDDKAPAEPAAKTEKEIAEDTGDKAAADEGYRAVQADREEADRNEPQTGGVVSETADGFAGEPVEEPASEGDSSEETESAVVAAVAAVGYDPSFVDETNQKLAELSAEIDALSEKTREVEKKVGETAVLQRKGFDKIKVVRYISPEEDGSPAPGYSIGITNQDCEGIVLTAVTRENQGTTLEVKSIRNGVANTPLSKAEECAVKRKNKE